MATVRIFGSPDCPVCTTLKKQCEDQALFKWDFVDANATETQVLCDEHDVDILPHVQILDDNGKVLWQQGSHNLNYSAVVLKFAKLA